ncbi:hypothetical protein BL253_36500 [Pseudofrankia asymbiotica]|uniref:Uncharacterized protein n=1 Tax=Pseudofrankia asymbiotica TaxID=1834516 RepID=A0A1V2HZC9_9ACTN|nr:hypothetical protein BL253_36500 [Pseudofrankia asymbiotica]
MHAANVLVAAGRALFEVGHRAVQRSGRQHRVGGRELVTVGDRDIRQGQHEFTASEQDVSGCQNHEASEVSGGVMSPAVADSCVEMLTHR